MPSTNDNNSDASSGGSASAASEAAASLQHGKPQIVVHISKSLNYTAFDARWIPLSARFVVLGQFARGTGAMQVYELEKGDAKLVHQAEKSAAFKCGTFGASSLHHRHLATGDFDGRMSVWDLERTDAPVYSVKAHESIINTIDGVAGASVGHGAPEIATGGRDGCVKIWDVRQKERPVASINPEEGETARDCWAVSFGNSYNNDERVVCAGYDNGDVKMFDLRMMALKWETNVKNGVCSIDFDRKDIEMNKVVVATLEANFHVYDLRTFHDKQGFASLKEKAHAATTIWSVRHLPQNRDIFATCGGDGGLQLFQYHYPEQRSKPVSSEDKSLVGVPGTVSLLNKSVLAQQPLASVDWSPDKLGLAVTTSFDQTFRVLIVTGLNKLR